MSDKNKDLLNPRYQVIADYPQNTLPTGNILNLEMNTDAKGDYWYFSTPTIFLMQDVLDKYPHLFRKLAWYEERDPKELPLYLSNWVHKQKTGQDEVLKVAKYDDPYYVEDCDSPHWSFYAYPEWNPDEGFPMIYFEPATESDYLTYQKQKDGK